MIFENFLKDLRATSKPMEKQDVLIKYDGSLLRYIIKATYEPFRLFHVSIKDNEIPESGNEDLSENVSEFMELLFFCENSESNKQNRKMVLEFLSFLSPGSQELVVRVLNKNWKAGISEKNILKLFPGIISSFNVQLANTYDVTNKKQTSIKEWLLSYKLDGLRCIALRQSSDDAYDKGLWRLYSRKGKEFLTVDHLKPQLEELYLKYNWSFFDGELYKHGLLFEDIQGLVMSFTKGQADEIEYHCFVAGHAGDFLAGKSPNKMAPLGDEGEDYNSDIRFTSLGIISNTEIYERLEEAFAKGYEGIMLRDPNNLYDYKRSNCLIKLKQGKNDSSSETVVSDCRVVGVEVDKFPVIEDGQMFYEELVVRLLVLQKDGLLCKVGSGFDLNFRRFYKEHPEEIADRGVEIEHQGWGKNGRMRFPRLKRIRLDL